MINKEDLRTLLTYVNLAGIQAQHLYYKYADTTHCNDAQYDAMLQLCSELFKKYKGLAPEINFTNQVGK